MVNTVNKIPSINLPLTNEQGVIHPIWYEFLRSFISNVGDSSGGVTPDNTVIAGAGILGTGLVDTINVGQGEGLVVNANNVAVNITGQINAQAAPEDEILIADASDLSQIRKTSLRDVVALAPNTLPGGNNGAMQYNNNGTFSGDNNVITDGAGNLDITAAVDIVGDLDVDDININSNIISSPTNLIFNVPAGGLDQFQFAQTGAASSAASLRLKGLKSASGIYVDSDADNVSTLADSLISFGTDNNPSKNWIVGLWDDSDADFALAKSTNNFGIDTIFTVDRGDNYFTHYTNMRRSCIANITASTTQSQGQSPLTADVNQVTTVANPNDVVTLPSAQSGSRITVINSSANTLQVFPAGGDDLGSGVNVSMQIAAGGANTFVAYDATNWTIETGSSGGGVDPQYKILTISSVGI